MKARDGFTLIDVVVAAALFLLIAGSALAMLDAGMRAGLQVAYTSVAQQLAQGELECLRQAPDTPSSCSLSQNGYTVAYTLAPSGSPRPVTVTVTPPGGGASYSLASYVLPGTGGSGNGGSGGASLSTHCTNSGYTATAQATSQPGGGYLITETVSYPSGGNTTTTQTVSRSQLPYTWSDSPDPPGCTLTLHLPM